MVDQTDSSVQRELGAIGAKIDGLTSEIRYRFDDVSKEVAAVRADADHGLRNVRSTIQALDLRIDTVEDKIAIDPAGKALIDARYSEGIKRVEALERRDVETTTERKTERRITWGVLSAIGAALVALATAVVSHDGLHL